MGAFGGTARAPPPLTRMASPVGTFLTKIGTLTARPEAFLVVLGYVGLWAVIEPDTLDWHGAATIATWLMTLVIQRSEHRDTQALHAKIDELLRNNAKADSNLTHVDEDEPEEVEKEREARDVP